MTAPVDVEAPVGTASPVLLPRGPVAPAATGEGPEVLDGWRCGLVRLAAGFGVAAA
ncbi:hypothetical protein [Kineococcus sp. NPDC059986]|uniref:hypothetical protein n=1 Tax=Kineococcus sp. NPDC059986 TaxID=3155538 RepID=UPI00344CF639